MGKYQFIYFDVRGRGQAVRYLVADNEIEWDEVVLTDFAEWTKDWKHQMQFGQLPCLRDGDLQIVQFNAILRHLGRKHDLYGDGLGEAVKIDMISDGIEDLRNKYTQMIYKNYNEGKQPHIDSLPEILKPFEKLLSENDAGKTGFCVGKKKSFVDYNMFDVLDAHLVLIPSCLDNFPTLSAFHKQMLARSGIDALRQKDIFKNRRINGNGLQ